MLPSWGWLLASVLPFCFRGSLASLFGSVCSPSLLNSLIKKIKKKQRVEVLSLSDRNCVAAACCLFICMPTAQNELILQVQPLRMVFQQHAYLFRHCTKYSLNLSLENLAQKTRMGLVYLNELVLLQTATEQSSACLVLH